VQHWLGHHSAAFTLTTYAHLLDGGVGAPLRLAKAAESGNTGGHAAHVKAQHSTGVGSRNSGRCKRWRPVALGIQRAVGGQRRAADLKPLKPALRLAVTRTTPDHPMPKPARAKPTALTILAALRGAAPSTKSLNGRRVLAVITFLQRH
jgi:hypothetical protein